MTEEEKAIKELMSMTDEELELVEFNPMKWVCAGKKCCRGTRIKDFGIEPIFFHPRKTIRFFDADTMFWMCEKHFKLYKHLKKFYPIEKVQEKLFDFSKQKFIPL